MNKQICLWLTLVLTSMFFFHLSSGDDHNSIFGALCYAQESDQSRERMFKDAKEALQKAEAGDVILLSPGNFARANEAYYNAQRDYEAGESIEKVQQNLQRAIYYIGVASEKAGISRSVLKQLIQTRKEAKSLEIPERAAYIFSKAESMFSDAAMMVENDNLAGARSAARDAEKEYRLAVIEGLSKFTLADASRKIKALEPTIPGESVRKARAELSSIEAFIESKGTTDFAIGELISEVQNRIQNALTLASTKPVAPKSEEPARSPEKSDAGGRLGTLGSIILGIFILIFTGVFVVMVSRSTKTYIQTTEGLVQAVQTSTEAIANVAEIMRRAAETADKLIQTTESSGKAMEQMARSAEQYVEATNQMARSMELYGKVAGEAADKLVQTTESSREAMEQMARSTEQYVEAASRVARSIELYGEAATSHATQPTEPSIELSEESTKMDQLNFIDRLYNQIYSGPVADRKLRESALVGIREEDSRELRSLKHVIFREKLDKAYRELMKEIFYNTAKESAQDDSE